MNFIEDWIERNKVNITDKTQDFTFKIENVIPPLFESYALIYHPYKIPKGEIKTEEQQLEFCKQILVKKVNKIIEKEVGIPSESLPDKKYDIEKTIRQKLKSKKIRDYEIDKKISDIGSEILSKTLEPLQKLINSPIEESLEKDKHNLREISWKELYEFYQIEFNNTSTWSTLRKHVTSEKLIANQKMPEMDIIPESVLSNILTFLKNRNIDKVYLNSQIGLESGKVKINTIAKRENINIIASIEKEWIFINPHDFCRTIVAGNSNFVQQIIDSRLFETSVRLNEDHRLNEINKK